MRFYVKVQLGKNRELLNSGYLLCKNVPIARTGQQIYGPDETPIEAGPDGRVVVSREASEVFRPETIASFNGVPLVNDHPEVDVTPENWKEYAVGIVFNVRRGVGTEDDLLLADILVTDAEAIRLILEEGKEELSCGYDAEYEEDGPGVGRQVTIVGNHVAMVDEGRCGWRCSIQDSVTPGGSVAKTIKISGWAAVKDGIMKAFTAKDEKALAKALDEAEKEATKDGEEEGEQHIHIHAGEATTDATAMDARITAMDKKIDDLIAEMAKDRKAKDEAEKEEKEAKDKKAKDEAEAKEKEEKEKTEDEAEYEEESEEGAKDARKAKDSAYMEDSFHVTCSNAEILAPGITFPTFDHASTPKATLDSFTALRKKALGIANVTTAGATVIAELRAGRPLTVDGLAKMKHGEVRTLFNGAALAMKQRNSAVETPNFRTADTGSNARKSLNERNAEFWAKQK